MTDSVPPTEAPVSPPAQASAASAPAANPARARRAGRGPRRASGAAQGQGNAPAAQQSAARRPAPPALQALAALYPRLFGDAPQPLKRGIFDDLLAAHPGQFEREALKLALGVHTRSTRYLQAVAAGQGRHDLHGQVVEPMAPAHVHHALWELYRRRQERGGAEWHAKIVQRMARNAQASGLAREDFRALVLTRDAAAQALLDEALAALGAQYAREDALLRAFEASGQSVAAFAEMYGMDVRDAERSLHAARSRVQAV